MEVIRDILAAADIGGTTCKLALFSVDGRMLEKWEIITSLGNFGERILPEVCRSIMDHADERSRIMKDCAGGSGFCHIRGICMGIPGAVDPNGCVPFCVNLGWGRKDLKREVSAFFPETELLCFGNDATLAALGELWKGAAKSCSSVYLLTFGTGIGGGYAERGGMLPGAHGTAGEVGHFTMNPLETRACSCGKCGCLEQYASARGLVDLARNLLELKSGIRTEYSLHIERMMEIDLPEGETVLTAMKEFTSKDICAQAERGEDFCKYVISLWGRIVGMALSYISCAIDPEVFVFAGGLSGAGQLLAEAVAETFKKNAFRPAAATPVLLSGLGNDAGIYGCIRNLLDALDFEEPIC